jgi:hypothetical protein
VGKQGSGRAENESLAENTARPKTTSEIRHRRKTEARYRPKETENWPASTRKKNLSRRPKTHAGFISARTKQHPKGKIGFAPGNENKYQILDYEQLNQKQIIFS